MGLPEQAWLWLGKKLWGWCDPSTNTCNTSAALVRPGRTRQPDVVLRARAELRCGCDCWPNAYKQLLGLNEKLLPLNAAWRKRCVDDLLNELGLGKKEW
jgi:hypothetical protein